MIGFTATTTNFPSISNVKSKIEEAIATAIAEDLQQKYQSASDFAGNSWVPKKGSGQLLVETGETFGTLQASGNIVEIAGKMQFHQEGTNRGLPARPIIGVSSDQERIAQEKGEEILESILK